MGSGGWQDRQFQVSYTIDVDRLEIFRGQAVAVACALRAVGDSASFEFQSMANSQAQMLKGYAAPVDWEAIDHFRTIVRAIGEQDPAWSRIEAAYAVAERAFNGER